MQIKQGFLPPTVTPQLPFETEAGGDDSVLSSEIQSKELEPERLLWSSILEDLRLRCTKATYDTILAYTRLASRDNNKFKVEVRGVVAYSWLEERLKPFVTRAIATATGIAEQEIELEFVQI